MESTKQPTTIKENILLILKGKNIEKKLFITSIISSLITLGIFWFYLYMNIANGYQAKGDETLAFLIMAMIAWVGLFVPTAILFFYDAKKAIFPSIPFALIILFFLGSAIALIDQKTGFLIVNPYREFAVWSYNSIKNGSDTNLNNNNQYTPTVPPLENEVPVVTQKILPEAKILYPNGDEILCSNRDSEIKWSVPSDMDIISVYVTSPTLKYRVGLFKATNNELNTHGEGDIPWNLKDEDGNTIHVGETYKIFIVGKYLGRILSDESDKSFSIISCEG